MCHSVTLSHSRHFTQSGWDLGSAAHSGGNIVAFPASQIQFDFLKLQIINYWSNYWQLLAQLFAQLFAKLLAIIC